jgi:hypothetical protein
VRFIVPLHDRYVGPALSLGLEGWLGACERTEIDAGHWVVLREPKRIAASGEHRALRRSASNGSSRASRGDAQRTRGRRVNSVG